MTPYATAQQAYRDSAILTAPPERLVVMLYDGANRFLIQGATATAGGRPHGHERQAAARRGDHHGAARDARHVAGRGGRQPRVDLLLLPAAAARGAAQAGPREDRPGREAPPRVARRLGAGRRDRHALRLQRPRSARRARARARARGRPGRRSPGCGRSAGGSWPSFRRYRSRDALPRRWSAPRTFRAAPRPCSRSTSTPPARRCAGSCTAARRCTRTRRRCAAHAARRPGGLGLTPKAPAPGADSWGDFQGWESQ